MRLVADPYSPYYVVQHRDRGAGVFKNITDRTEQLVVTHSGTGKTSKIEVTLDNEDQALFWIPELMRKGTRMVATFGYPGRSVDAGEFAIKSHRPSMTTLGITAHEAKRSKMLRRTKARTFDNMRRSDVVLLVLREHGFSSFTGEPTAETFPVITQTAAETDWELLQRLADLEKRDFYLAADGAHWELPRRKDRPTTKLRQIKNAVGPGDIMTWRVESLEAGVPGRLIAKAYDPLTAKEYTVIAGDASGKGKTEIVRLADSEDFTDPDTGDQIAGGTVGRDVTLNLGAVTEQDAKRRLDSLFQEQRYNALKLEITCIGDPFLRARQNIVIQGIGPALDGVYRTREVVHRLGGSGYTCDAKLARDGMNKVGRGRKVTNQPSKDELDIKTGVQEALTYLEKFRRASG